MFAKAGGKILFTAEAGLSGTELWSFGDADCGDAADPAFPTLIANGGACHRIDSSIVSPILGASIDRDTDGQPGPAATGDDSNGIDDEDGVSFNALLDIGSETTVDVTLSSPGVLNAWFDWNGNGNWDAPEDWTLKNLDLGAGTHSLTLTVPTGTADGDVTTGTINARFRLSSVVLDSPAGITFDGEVEDHQVTLTDALDFGDAPDPTYPTLQANDGARHRVSSSYFLGSSIDAENDGQPTTAANGDDSNGINDDDGITFVDPLIPGSSSNIDTETTGDGYLNAWIDFNADGDWDDTGEKIIDDEFLNAGSNTWPVSVPGSATQGATYARFRFDSDSDGYTPTGFSPDGEVEDYRVNIVGLPTDLSISLTDGQSTAIPGKSVTYTLVVRNLGPEADLIALVADNFPGSLSCSWTSTGSGGVGGSTNASGAQLNDTLSMPAGSTATYKISCSIAPGATGNLSNSATVTASSSDTNASNNSATDTDLLVANSCAGPNEHIAGGTTYQNQSVSCWVSGNIITGSPVTVKPTADVSYRGATVTLSPQFHAQSGSRFRASTQ